MQNVLALMVLATLVGACKGEEKTGGASTEAAQEKATPPAATTAPARTITELELTRVVLPAGSEFRTTDSSDVDFTIVAGGTEMKAKTRKNEVRHVEVIEVANDALQRIRVHYEVSKESQAFGAESRNTESILHGKTYLVWSNEGKIEATTDDGSNVSEEEERELASDWRGELGEIPGLEKFISGRAWSVGQEVALTADQLEEVRDEDPNMTVKSGTIMLATIDESSATFEVALDTEQRSPEGTLSIPLTTTLELDTSTARPRLLESTGTMSGRLSGNPTTGTAKSKTVYEYL